jgi:hypothetical protein
MNSFARTENFAGGSGKIISAIWECRMLISPVALRNIERFGTFLRLDSGH